MPENDRLVGLHAIVTGAADGIGEAIARVFAQQAAGVLAVDLAESGIEDKLGSISAIDVMSCDVAEAGAAGAIVAAAVERLGAIDIVVNNAGVASKAHVESLTDEDWSRTLEINVGSMFRLCREAIPWLKKSPAGRIINVGSVLSSFGAEGLAAYVASKHAVAGLTRTLATELGRDGITANFLQPGAIVTGMTRESFRSDIETRDFWIEKSAAGRLGEPLDVARVALFLASDDAGFVSGQGIVVDGGAMQSV